MATVDVRTSVNPARTLMFDALYIIVGKAKNLKALNFDALLKVRFGDCVSARLWAQALLSIPRSGIANIPLYLNNARIISIADDVSRHNSPSNAIAIYKELKNFHKPEGVKHISITLLADWVDIFASVAAVARSFPMYECRTNIPCPLETVELEVIVADKKGVLSPIDVAFLQNICLSVRSTAKLVDAPGNVLHAEAFTEEAVRYAGGLDGVKTFVLKGEELLRRGFGGIYHVGKASIHQPAFLCFSYEPQKAKKTYALVGKGIVFDSGGLSLKGRTVMQGMKQDMGGAAAVLASFCVLVKSGFTENIHCVLCIAENMIAANAMRPDDIITLLSGRNVEVNNTDAEGRLVLADGVYYAKNVLRANVIIDMATLTGAQLHATGRLHAAVLTNSEEWEKLICKAGQFSGDLVHPLPYCPDLHFGDLKSSIADMRNANFGKMQGPPSSVAGLFIAANIDFAKNVDWIHIDMAHVVEFAERATGFGPALICALLRDGLKIDILNANK